MALRTAKDNTSKIAPLDRQEQRQAIWVTCVVLITALAWSYWPVLQRLILVWRTDDDYSVGALVPLAAAYIVWDRRRILSQCMVSPCWWGAAILLAAVAMRAFGLVFYFKSAERYSLVLTIIGLILLVAGREVVRRLFWVLAMLFLMVPLPGRVHTLIAGVLQELSTGSAYLMLELLGVAVIREGNVLFLGGDLPVAVAEACSGLRMLTAFVVVACVMALVVRRRRWQKAILVLSSVLVAVVCNVARLVVTSLVYLAYDDAVAERFFHDFAGLAMMPVAIAILCAEIWLMDLLVPPPKDTSTVDQQ